MKKQKTTEAKPPARPADAVKSNDLTDDDLRHASYEVALGKVRESEHYQNFRGICEDPFLTKENYYQILNFLKKGASRFWKYLLLRESGEKDADVARAAHIVEYARILADLVERYPEFQEKITDEIVERFPEEFRKKKPLSPEGLLARLEQLNERDYLGTKPAPGKEKGGGNGEIDRLFADFSFTDQLDEEEEEESTEMWAQEASPDEESLPPYLKVSLQIIKGPDKNKEIFVKEAPILIGRDPLSPIRIQSKKVSRQHAVLSYREHRFYIKDLESTNGTLVNHKKTTESIIKNGDLLQFGDVVCRFIAEPK